MNNPSCDYWEGYNEPIVESVEKMKWMAAFEVKRVQLLAGFQRKACIGGFASGAPDISNAHAWSAFYPAIDEAIKYGGILGLHEYDWPNMNSSNGMMTLRYRKVYDLYLKPAQKIISLVITECGLDSGGSQNSGWKSGKLNALQYSSQLEWYDSELMKDSYVKAATIYQIGIPGWMSFSIGGDCASYITEYVKNS